MGEMITAIYEKGILRPTRRLTLPERTRVGLRIVVQYENETDERQKVRQALLDTGVIQPHPSANIPSPVTEADLLAAAQTLGAAGPLSTVILADR
jgi:predicted DNA-binding antitoxin AbrB/MazE fold protein